MALKAFMAMLTTISMSTTVIKARYRTVASTLIRQGVSIRSLISEEMKCAMGAAE
jgi:hypothetical protein